MRKLMYIIIATTLLIKVKAQETGSFKDPRDDKTYKTVKIGNQVWMAENLAYKPSGITYWAYDNNQYNEGKFGYLYDWQIARNVCPIGWHLPSDAEWTVLMNVLGKRAGKKLKATSGWKGLELGNGTDEYGFSALPGGFRSSSTLSSGTRSFRQIEKFGGWWSSSEYSSKNARCRYIRYSTGKVKRSILPKPLGLSVRCVMD